MANGRMSNSELSDSIKNYIKDMFDTNIKAIIEQHNTIIIDLKDTILELQTQIKNNNKHNDSNTILYSSMVTKILDEIKCTINDTVTKNIENIYEDSNRKKTLIIYNIEEKKFNKKIDKFKYDKDSINSIISEISDVENISIQNIHRIGKINIDSETNEIINNTIRPIKITLNTELDKMHILNMAYKLKNTKYSRIGISHEFTTEQLITQKKLLTEAKDKTNNNTIFKVRFINNNFKLISHTIIESQNGT